MEYLFRNSVQKSTSLRLDDYSFTFRADGKEEVISYAGITNVRMYRESARVYKTVLYPDGHRPIIVSSRSVSEGGGVVDQSGAYTLFVRVLHHHLKDKSHAKFAAAAGKSNTWQWALGSALLAPGISALISYLGLSFAGPYIQSVALTTMAVIIVVGIRIKTGPKSYSPSEPPLQFLP